MRLFSIDLHISVAADIRFILNSLYNEDIQIERWCLSYHHWVIGEKYTSQKEKGINIWKDLNEENIIEFQKKYDSYLNSFDGFIVTHAVGLCLLFEKYQKPILLINSCRYNIPYSKIYDNSNLDMWKRLNDCLIDLNNKSLLIPVSNNLADQKYLKLGTGIESTHIPSLCSFMNLQYNKKRDDFLLFNRKENTLALNNSFLSEPKDNKFVNFLNLIERKLFKLNISKVIGRNNFNRAICKYSGIVHIPYEISTMSIFEQYTANIPLVFPSKMFLKKLIQDDEIYFQSPYDLDTYDNLNLSEPLSSTSWVDFWVDKADYYDKTNFKYITYFDTIDQLDDIVSSLNTNKISSNMKIWNSERTNIIMEKWRAILAERLFKIDRPKYVHQREEL